MGIEDQLFHWLTETLTHLYDVIGWAGVVVIMALESANLPIPSEVTMPLAGWLLLQAKGHTMFRAILEGGFYGGFGCLVGSLASYGLGAWGGRPFLERYGRYLLVTSHDLEKAQAWFTRWGDWASFISRLLPIVRTFISLPAGIFRVNLTRFSILTFVGSFIWCGALSLVGYLVGQRVEEIHGFLRPVEIPIAIVLVVGFVIYVWRHIRAAQINHKVESDTSVED